MLFPHPGIYALVRLFSVTILALMLSTMSFGQSSSAIKEITANNYASPAGITAQATNEQNADQLQPVSATIAPYFNPIQGTSSSDLVRRALTANAEISAARLDIERGRARLRQAGLLPNPSLDFEHTTGRLTDVRDEGETSIGIAIPIELGGKRGRRIDLAKAELAAAEAEVADRERRLIRDVRTAYVEALAALRELETLERLSNLDLQTTRIVEIRVKEGDAAPIELNLLQAEVDRLRARRALVEGRLESAMLRLRSVAGMPLEELLQLREDLTAPLINEQPGTLEEAIEIALRTRPDVQLARLNEEVAKAGLRLARAQSTPDLTAFAKYSQERSAFDNTPVGSIFDKDKLVTFGVSISIPIFNRNQGAKAEAATAITQAQRRREFAEQVVRAEVASAFARYQAAQRAIDRFEKGVIARSTENIRIFREAYNLGEYRITDLVNEQRRLVDSQREFTEALAERYRALADLQAAIGVLNP